LGNTFPCTIRYGRKPTVPLQLSNKQYVEDQDQEFFDNTTEPAYTAAIAAAIAAIPPATGIMGDIGYLAEKAFAGKRVDVDGGLVSINNSTTETDLATQTATAAHDMYLGEIALHIFNTSSSGNQCDITIRVYVNGTVVETYKLDNAASTTLNITQIGGHIPLISKGNKVATGEIIKVTAQHSSADPNNNSTYTCTLLLWEELTGVDPS